MVLYLLPKILLSSREPEFKGQKVKFLGAGCLLHTKGVPLHLDTYRVSVTQLPLLSKPQSH